MLAGAADVVRVQVGEYAHLEMDAGDPVHHQALAGDLHHHAVAPCGQHLAEHFLQLVAFRGGIDQRPVYSRVGHAVGADDAALVAARVHHGMDHVGGGGLALGAGHADGDQLFGGPAEVVAGEQRQRPAAAFHLHHCYALGHLVQLVLDHQHRSALLRHIYGVVVAVPVGAHNAHKGPAGLYLTGIVGDVHHFGVQAALHQRVVQPIEQFL